MKHILIFRALLKGYHYKNTYRDSLIDYIDYYESSCLGSNIARMYREELERLDRLVDR